MSTITLDTKTTSTITSDTLPSASSMTLDSKGTSSITSDSRPSASSASLDAKGTGIYLWRLLLPWAEELPWKISGNSSILNEDLI